MSATLFVPLVGDTVTHGAAACTTVHLRAPPPVFFTCTVCEGALVPTFVCTLTDVGVTESVACAATGRGRRIAMPNRTNPRTDCGQRGTVFIRAAGGPDQYLVADLGSMRCFLDSRPRVSYRNARTAICTR